MMSETRPWKSLGLLDPRSLSDTRLQLHWAIQAVGALANRVLDKLDDDSQDNLGWRGDVAAMVTHPLGHGLAAGLRLATAELVLANETGLRWQAPINGSTLQGLLALLRDEASKIGLDLEGSLALRDYEMPVHAVQKGAAFEVDLASSSELATWFANADGALRRATQNEVQVTDLRCWPHHFDLGLLVQLDPEQDPESARTIGMGLSPGDGSYGEPYFYVSPFPAPNPESLPQLDTPGHWHTEGFLSRVLTATELLEAEEGQAAVVESYLRSALEASHQLLRS